MSAELPAPASGDSNEAGAGRAGQGPGDTLRVLRERVAQAPADVAALGRLAETCSRAGLWPEALAAARRGHRMSGDPRFLALIADSLYWLGEREEFDALVASIPSSASREREAIAGPLIMHLLKRGDVAGGLALQGNLREPLAAQHRVLCRGNIPWWDGAPFAGTLLLSAMQGLGEEILLSSFFTELAGRCGQAVIECDPRLLPLYRRSFPGLTFVSRNGTGLADAANAAADARKTLAPELARLFLAQHERRAAHAWLQADPGRRAEFRQDYEHRWPGRRIVGVCWRSFRAPWGPERKSLPLVALAATLTTAGAQFVSLQHGPVTTDLDAARAAGLPLPYSDPAVDTHNDIDALAAQIGALDAVVTTSNTIAHLAGALGKPCFVLLPHRDAVMWFWGYAGDSTRWYPSVHLVRGHAGDDRSAFDRRVAGMLSSFYASNLRGGTGTP